MAVSAAPSREAIEKVAKAMYAAINALDVDAYVACFAADAENHDPEGTPPHVGEAGLREFFNGMSALIDSVNITTDALHVSGNGVAAVWRVTARGKNGEEATAQGVDVLTVNAAGRIQEGHAYWDAEAFVGALM